jgi:hypothetical protein
MLKLKTGNNVQLSVPALASVITFSSVLKPRPNILVPAHVSLIPAAEVHLREVTPAPTSKAAGKKTGVDPAAQLPIAFRTLEHCSLVSEGSGKLSLTCAAAGISHQAVLERRERQLQRQKKAEKRRRREAKERNERRAAREEEREQLRLQLLAERKAKKLAEREARRRRAEASAGVAPKTIKSSNSLTRLAAAAEAPAAGVRGKGASTRDASPAAQFTDSAASTAVSTPEPTTRSARAPVNGVPMLGKQPSAGNSELMAAMARRRAKDE